MLRRRYDSTTMPNIQNEYQTLKIVLVSPGLVAQYEIIWDPEFVTC